MVGNIQTEEIREISPVERSEEIGSIVYFKGIVRKTENGKPLKFLHYEAEMELGNQEIGKIIAESKEKFGIHDADVIHRVGDLKPGDVSLFVEVYSSHRDEGFEACKYIVDEIKRRVPIWKQDVYEDGTKSWH